MTNETEKKFFDAFGIKPDCLYHFLIAGSGSNLAARTIVFGKKEILTNFITKCGGEGRVIKSLVYYPEITDRILLKLICLLVAHYWKTKEHYYLTALDEEHLRKEILSDACYVIDGMLSREKEVDFINQVRALFGEKEEK